MERVIYQTLWTIPFSLCFSCWVGLASFSKVIRSLSPDWGETRYFKVSLFHCRAPRGRGRITKEGIRRLADCLHVVWTASGNPIGLTFGNWWSWVWQRVFGCSGAWSQRRGKDPIREWEEVAVCENVVGEMSWIGLWMCRLPRLIISQLDYHLTVFHPLTKRGPT